MQHITVGTTQRNYAMERNVFNSPVPDVDFVPAGNLFRYPNYALFKAFGYINPLIENLQIGARGVDLLHFFNRLSLGRTPWVTTFETLLPRWDHSHPAAIPFGLGLLARPACRRLIALSANARDFQLGFLEDRPRFADTVAAKLAVLHPPQPLLVDAPKPPPEGDIRFAFVGSEFFRKGGGEILRAFDRLFAEGAPVHLTIVSTLGYGDGESRTTRDDQVEAKRLLAKWPGRIDFHERLPNPAVLDLFRQSHVALLPTWADSYGYSVLEAQAAACPVLSTNVRAIPEINDDAQGWMIPVPKDRFGNARFETPVERKELSRIIQAGIERQVAAILADPGQVAVKSANALARIRAEHSPEQHGLSLRAIYDEALRP